MTDSLRVIRLSPAGKNNLFADLGNYPSIPTPFGDFHFQGGHRLWYAPEQMPRTYAPDSGELSVTMLDDGIILITDAEQETGISKGIEVRISHNSPFVTLTHTLFNHGDKTIELAPWTITQLRLGGTVFLPMATEKVDDVGLLPNRQFSFWPYSNLSDSRLILQDECSFFKAKTGAPFKMGYFNPHGWLAYWVDGILFKKTFDAQVNIPYPDNNSNAEIYCNQDFVELESLAPLLKLSPGASVQHMEEWEVLDYLPSEFKELLNNIQ